MTERMPLAQAQVLAAEFAERIRPYCERVEIAGSIRRRKPDVKDIEIVCLPTLESRTVDLFGTVEFVAPLDVVCEDMLRREQLAMRFDSMGRAAWGQRYKRAMYKGVPLDLFICRPPAQFGVLMTIRTGPAEFSKRLVTQKRFGGLLPDYWHAKDGAIWNIDGLLQETTEETDVFALLGIDWIAPEDRG